MFRDHRPTAPALQADYGCMSKPNVSSASVNVTKQPTYTTVGSIYNPKAATPIQPPTRRARTRRCPPPFRSPSGEPYPPFTNALLSALPVSEQAPLSPPTTAATLRQYSPLQQNYDRAVSPAPERENPRLTAGGMSTVPSIRPGNLPSPVGFGGNDSVASEDSLTSRITVKSLTNLASYSNPMQKAAQKALARARTANLGVHRAEASSQFLSPGSDVSKDRLPGTYRPTPGAAGPPQPLTAGPPGHRPYKPSSLEAASRIPHLDGQSVQAPLKTTTTTTTSGSQSRSPPMGLPYTIASSVLATIDDDDKVEGTIQPGPFRFDETNHGSLPYNQPELTGYRHPPTEIPSETTATSVEHAKPKIHDTLPPERIEKYYPRGFPHNYVGRHQPVKEDGYMSFPTMNGQLAQKACPEQVNRIHQNFYAGSKAFTKKLDSLVGDNNNRCLESKVGIIGEERERLRGSNIEKFGADGEIQSQFLSVEEANRMNGSDATRPLIELALATLLGYKEASKTGIYQWPCSFIKADDAWVDDSDEGNTSFFSKPKDELKKRRIVKKARRGY